MAPGETFETLNESGSILVMVDEAHRSQATVLHANLMNALPNAARIGFTGTPIIMGERKKTLEIFGGYLDRYTLAESEADGSTVPIFYEGRTTDAAVRGASKMDDLFFRWFRDLGDDERKILQHRYATAAQVLEAPRADRSQGQGHPAPLHRHGDARRLQGDGRGHQPRGEPALPTVPCWRPVTSWLMR